jgi:aryl-alcohol dehydrogenase-like predicted oxidoreductase
MAAKVPHLPLDGVDIPVSRLVIGCDNQMNYETGAAVWDAWIEAGGNAFDTAWIYGGGVPETLLGQWMKARGVTDNTVVVVKGAHTPHCTPQAIGEQLPVSLERLQLDRAPIYIMHRDNPNVPVGEFVEAINGQIAAGHIGVYGGSNWTVERFEAARDYAKAHGLKSPSILNNNLSLAVMEKPVWPGCISSNDAQTLAHLRREKVAHFSWSSQARGYFLPQALRNRLPADTAPETCFGSERNAERRRRAQELAEKRGVSAHNVATAWVLAQDFPSFALVGPRNAGEIASTLPGLAVQLTADEAAWLNLEDEQV